jgi:hypothetical protein
MYQKIKRTLNKIGEWIIGFSESIAEARIQQANFYMYGHCKNIYDVERTEKEQEQKADKNNGIHWQ